MLSLCCVGKNVVACKVSSFGGTCCLNYSFKVLAVWLEYNIWKIFHYNICGKSGSITTLLHNWRFSKTKQNRVYYLFKGCHRSLLARLPLLVIFCNKMAVVPESRVLTFSVFKWSSYSSTYLPEWVVHTLGGPVQTSDCAVTGGLLSPQCTSVSF